MGGGIENKHIMIIIPVAVMFFFFFPGGFATQCVLCDKAYSEELAECTAFVILPFKDDT